MTSRMRPAQPQAPGGDDGRAVLEVVFLAVLLLIPTLYVVISIFRVQAATFAVTQAAREVGRVMDTAPDAASGLDLAHRVAAVALTDQHVPPDGVLIRFTQPGQGCPSGSPIPPRLAPGAQVDICVTVTITLPGVPTVLTGADNTVTGVYTLRIGDFREPS